MVPPALVRLALAMEAAFPLVTAFVLGVDLLLRRAPATAA